MKKALIYFGITVFINILFILLTKFVPAFSEWYAVYIYPVIVAVFARVSNLAPIALAEILLYIFFINIICGLIILFKKLIKKHGSVEKIKTLLRAIVVILCVTSTFMMTFMLGAGINYNRNTFSEYSGLELQLYDTKDLKNVIDEVTYELGKLVTMINTDDNGVLVIDKKRLAYTARVSMHAIAEIYPELDTYYPRPKPVLLSGLLLSNITTAGIFSPFTIEALYNSHMPDSQQPSAACHELAHLSGFMREDEANFIAFLACRESLDSGFMYSGYINALTSLMNAYYTDAGVNAYREAYMALPAQVRTELDYWRKYWEQYHETAVSKAASAVNDAYLVANGQTDGIKSYGRMVDLLIADYLSRNNE